MYMAHDCFMHVVLTVLGSGNVCCLSSVVEVVLALEC